MDERDRRDDVAERAARCPRLFPHDGWSGAVVPRAVAEVARVTVGAGHFGELIVPGETLGSLPYLDDRGTPVVLVPRDQALPSGQVGFRVNVPSIGQVALLGIFGDFPLPPDQARRVGELLLWHRGCLSGRLDRSGATPRALELRSVLVDSGPDCRANEENPRALETAPPEIVEVADYGRIELDLFAELGPALAAHLTRVHQGLLLSLATCCGLSPDPLAVAIRRVCADAVGLELFDADGSRPVRLRFSTPLGHPHQLAAALHTMTGGQPV